MRVAAAFALTISASLLVLGPASAQQSTTGSAPPLVAPAAPSLVAPAPTLVPGGANALRPPPSRPARRSRRRLPPSRRRNATTRMRSASRALSRSTPPAARASDSSISSNSTSSATTRSCSPSTTVRGRRRPPCSRRSPTECVKAIFFPIGKHATYYPEILAGRSSRSHHRLAHLVARRSFAQKTPEDAKAEIEKGHQRREVGA